MNPLSTRPNRWRPITVFNLLVGLLFSITALGQPAFLKEGLVAYYPFNGNANDESGNGLAIKNNGAILQKDRFGVEDSSYYFNGTNTHMISEEPIKNLELKEYTVSIWVRANMNEDGGIAGYYSTAGSIGNSGYGLNIVGRRSSESSSRFGFIAGRYSAGGVWDYALAELSQSTGLVWKHLVGIRKNGISHIYVDAVQQSGSTSIEPSFHSSSRLCIGADMLNYVQGDIDDVRIYNRALSETEVKALYNYESQPQPKSPSIATATAQVVNGFVVGAIITDAGNGYVFNPIITITGGGGTGAKATATQFNGVVTSITITNPGSGYTSTPTITIAPPPFPPRKATSTAQIVNGFVVGTKITDGGFGYDSPPAVLLVGGGGSGATAVATVANGVITAITISNPGTGYTSSPIVRIASPPFAPKLGIETSKVFVRMSVVLGRKYQLEASTDLNTWTSTGPSFIAQDEELVQEFDVNQVGQYFRINQVP